MTADETPVRRSDEALVSANDVELCVQTFGYAADPAVLLIAGALCSMDWWGDELCARLAAAGRFVIRYDHRDTGRSTSFPAGAPPYSGADLIADALGVLDALGVPRAHLVGMSMGGGIALRLAFDRPARVASLTLVGTTAGGDDLPDMDEALARAFAEPGDEPDWSDRDAAVEAIVDGERPFAGAGAFDEPWMRTVARRVVDRTTDLAASMTNHMVVGGPTDALRARLPELDVPTLVVHGTDDPLFPLAHGRALAAEIPGAQLVTLPGVGHQMPPPATWDVVAPAIVEHTAGGDGVRAP